MSNGPDPMVDIVIPVLNEARTLEVQVQKLLEALVEFPFTWRVTIADNGSDDGTAAIARRLDERYVRVRSRHLDQRGRGRALRVAWSTSDAPVLAYMDVDLSTDLAALHPLIAPLLTGHSDIAIGSRLLPSSSVVRGPKREVISRSYNALLRVVLGARFHDAQCGFKAIRADAARALLPEITDQAWFFDTELLVRAQRHGMRVVEIPVDWFDDPDSRVDIVSTAWDDLRGVGRLVRELGPRRAAPPFLPVEDSGTRSREAA